MSYDTDGTDEILCPHCGFEEGDSWEHDDKGGILECESCGKKYRYDRDVTVTYTSTKIEASQ